MTPSADLTLQARAGRSLKRLDDVMERVVDTGWAALLSSPNEQPAKGSAMSAPRGQSAARHRVNPVVSGQPHRPASPTIWRRAAVWPSKASRPRGVRLIQVRRETLDKAT